MSVYLHKFATQAECDAYTGSEQYVEPFTALIVEGSGKVVYNVTSGSPVPPGPTPPVYSAMPLTFKFDGSSTIEFSSPYAGSGNGSGNAPAPTLKYSINGSEYVTITDYSDGISVNEGDEVSLIGDKYYLGAVGPQPEYGILKSVSNDQTYSVYGNIMSLYSENFDAITSMPQEYNLVFMFEKCSGLTTAENLILPATTLSNGCYEGMFSACTSLVTAPVLPAVTLVEYCYSSLFAGCTSLNYIKCLATGITATLCTSDWVQGLFVPSESHGGVGDYIFVKSPDIDFTASSTKPASGWYYDSSSVPFGWTVINDGQEE